jgi:hypothetical protein
MKELIFVASLAAAYLFGCSDGSGVRLHPAESKTKLIYFGFDDHSEKPGNELAQMCRKLHRFQTLDLNRPTISMI